MVRVPKPLNVPKIRGISEGTIKRARYDIVVLSRAHHSDQTSHVSTRPPAEPICVWRIPENSQIIVQHFQGEACDMPSSALDRFIVTAEQTELFNIGEATIDRGRDCVYADFKGIYSNPVNPPLLGKMWAILEMYKRYRIIQTYQKLPVTVPPQFILWQ